ncbi:nucleoside hydrolase-like domain-containing protein [Planctomycetota bacterium]
MMHLLMYANEFDVEGLIAVTGRYLRGGSARKGPIKPELFHMLINGYAEVYPNLRKHADNWPTPAQLHMVTAGGQYYYGIEDSGEGKTSPGSLLIEKALKKDDPRPVYVVVNAGSNTLAQALYDLKKSETPEEFARLLAKLRVYENGAQDNSGAWIVHAYPDIHWIRSNYQTYAWMGRGGPYCWEPYPETNPGQHRWAKEHIQTGHGPLGELYPDRFHGNGFIEGGGTAPWMGLVQKGVYDPDHPDWGGWSGRFSSEKVKNVWSRHAPEKEDEQGYGDFFMYPEIKESWTDPVYGKTYDQEEVPVWRWRRHMLDDFRGRMDWCLQPYDQANHNPIAVFNKNRGDETIFIKAQRGAKVMLSAAGSSDPDGDELVYAWYVYPQPKGYEDRIAIDNADSVKASITVPATLPGDELHVILEVADDSDFVTMRDYRRIVLEVE